MSRYTKTQKENNDLEFYSSLREKRDVKSIEQYRTVILHNPSIAQRVKIQADTHIWKYGDRYYKLATNYYNDPSLWWIIAWYNGTPTEASIAIGDRIKIPINLEQIIEALRL